MKTGKKRHKDPGLNRQFENAFNWLRSNQYIKTAAQLAQLIDIPKSTVSEYLNNKRRLGLVNAVKFEQLLLKPHKLTLQDFDTTILNRQVKLAHKPKAADIASLTSTMLLYLESGQEIILDKLTEMQKEIGELRELVTKLSGRKASA